MPARTDPEALTEVAPLDPAERSPTVDAPTLVAGRYELLGMLGSGAMGTVYRARDRELDETVALKVLKKELAGAPGMLERFRREVKLARRVTHRNVARTFDIGEHGGDRFLTMEFVDGEMLGSLLARRGRLELAEAVAVARDVCAGLAAAHAAGVLHRDLKPENVIVASDGRAVITDFGIARAVAEAELRRTGGGLVGTPAYMAPEQVEGRPDLDARADLYALGAMLYELLTGQMAWTGDSVVSIAAARLLRPPPNPRERVPELPAVAAELVLRLLARRPEDRFESAEATAAALAELEEAPGRPAAAGAPAVAAPARANGRRSVAVLPLVNLGDQDDDYLGQTLTEDLVDVLSVVPELRVRPRGLTLPFSDPARDVREAGRALGVDVVVDGSVRRFGEAIRVAVRLVTVEDGFQLWAKRFERRPAEVLTVAEEAAHAVATVLTASPVPHARAPAPDPVAQESYLRGRFLLNRGWYEINRAAIALLEDAYARAPDDPRIAGTFALALARGAADQSLGAAAQRRAREAAEHALSCDRTQPEARTALGVVHLAQNEGAAAAAELRRALALAPNAASALDVAGRLLGEVGCVDEGLALLERALAIEPGIMMCRQGIARARALRGDWEGAEEAFGPPPPDPRDQPLYFLTRARLALWRGDASAVERVAADFAVAKLPPGATRAVGGLLRVARERRMPLAELEALDETLPVDPSQSPRRTAFNAQTRAEVLLAIGALDDAVAMLRRADANALYDVAWMDGCPLLSPVRDRADVAAVREACALRAARIAEAWREAAG